MKKISFIVFIAVSLIFMSFSSPTNSSTLLVDDYFVEASIGDMKFNVTGEKHCFAYDWGNGEYGFYGAANPEDLENSETIVMAFNGECKVGEYPLISDNQTAKYMVYWTDGEQRFTSFSEEGGVMNITQVTDTFISGSFKYMGFDEKQNKSLPVEGSFKLKLTAL